MRRRSRKNPNLSESTGKIGQEIPQNQPRPLVPLYPEEAAQEAPPPRHASGRHRAVSARQTPPSWKEQAGTGKLEIETQPELPAAPTPQPNAAGQTPKGYVVLAIGLPGSGKTTWFGRRGVMPLSSDMLRGILFDDVEEQRFQGLVFSTLRSLLRARLIAKMPWNYVDATNLSAHERRQWIKMAKSFGYEVHAVFFDVPLEVCLERNRSRDRMVSEEVMRKMAEKLKPPVFEEGFEKITVVRVKSQA
ncbi:MAG TPA: AAA family ATPase [Terracidiphilus sp.]|nr:AAA family ATPase [Terracidiphilus sp.]